MVTTSRAIGVPSAVRTGAEIVTSLVTSSPVRFAASTGFAGLSRLSRTTELSVFSLR